GNYKMRNFKASLVVLAFILGTIGMAFALFTFDDSTSVEKGLGLKVEDYVEFGELTAVVKYYEEDQLSEVNGIVIDNEEDQVKYYAEVTLTHIYDENSETRFEDVDYENAVIEATFEAAWLSNYF